MSSTPSGSRCPSSVRSLFVSLAVLLFVAQGTPRALASSLGVLSGTVTSAQTKAPLPGVRVTVTAPTGTYHATTDARGFFSITGVFADTYTVSYEIQGYQAVSRSGVTVNADQTQIADASLTKALRTIARVATRSIGGAFQPNQRPTRTPPTRHRSSKLKVTRSTSVSRSLLRRCRAHRMIPAATP